MTLETKHNLKSETIEQLQELIQANLDSSNGFCSVSEEITENSLATLFNEIGNERAQMAEELQRYVEWNGEEAQTSGSLLAAIHRVWIGVRATLSGADSAAILAEAEAGEDHIKGAYEDALKETAGSAVNDVLLSQYKKVKSGHDRIRDLRDLYKAQK